MKEHCWMGDYELRNTIKYTDGYKYQTERVELFQTKILGSNVSSYWIRLTPDGVLWIKKGYAWDGPSGPTIDTKSFMRGSLVHDSLCQLARLGLIPNGFFMRKKIDSELDNFNKTDGMSWWRRKYVRYFVKKFGKFATRKNNRKKILTSPRGK